MKTRFITGMVILLLATVFLVFSDTGKKSGKEDVDLKRKLTPLQYKVTQQCGTEKPFKNEYWDNKEPGIYVDIVSGEPLFSSKDKFKSGSGWPSFTKPLKKELIVYKKDTKLGMVRTEVKSKKADSHLGHVFSDGPETAGGMRYCINSASLRFIHARDLEKEGYDEYKEMFKDFLAKDAKRETATAVFGAGCFWGVEDIFENTIGVKDAVSGYMGGHTKNPTYGEVCSNKTGHAEVVKVTYHPDTVTYEKLLDIFWRMHNPTSIYGRSQYRSAIFYTTKEQKKIAEKSKKAFDKSGVFGEQAATEITKAGTFYPAEKYHQNYYRKHGNSGCHVLRKK